MKITIENLSLTYPLRSLDHYLFRSRLVQIFKNFFLKNKNEENIKKNKNLTALKNISFELQSNDRCGLIGLNGSGKSTLLSCLSGIIEPTTGNTNIDYKYSIPIIQPYTICEGDDTVRNNIIIVGLLLGFSKKKIVTQISQILKFSELEDYENLPFATLSQGMKFRMVFATCFILEGKKIYFIDEFFTTGDEKFQNFGFQYIKDKSDCIIIVCSHNRKIIEKFCNKILVLNKGDQVFFGDIHEGLKIYDQIINL